MKPELKIIVTGHINFDYGTPYINSKGEILETPLPGAKFVKVKLEHGPNKENEVCLVPISMVFWRKQN